ncbi:MAG TPA: CPBP family glutamic-type intramembrane protease [Saprospiraceae bacterium]
MAFKCVLKLVSIAFISLYSSGILLADTLDHALFLKEINNSQDLVYSACLAKYDAYLKDHPNDITVHIERCKFIQFAEYDDVEGYNPNQAAFDSSSSAVVKQFPTHPQIFLFQISYLWGDELETVFEKAEEALDLNPEEWNETQAGILYKAMSDHYYSEPDLPKALTYIEKAIDKDAQYKTSLDYARILIDSDRKEEALQVLKAGKDTTKIAWEISNKADLYLQLKDFARALDLYNRIDEIDSTYNNNANIANTLEGVGEYEAARKYLVADTSKHWSKESSLKKLLLHDLNYQDGAQGLATYNAFRDHGYSMDPLGLYRLKLFFSHPLQPWKFRDILGLVTLRAVFLCLIAIPFIWILPIYFIGHHLSLISHKKAYELNWGLKAFWLVSTGFLMASVAAFFVEPEYLYSLFLDSYFNVELSQEKEGLISILFVLLFALVGLASLYKVTPRVLLSDKWPIRQAIFYGIGALALYKLVVGIYILIAISQFGLSMEDLTGMLSHFLAGRQDIEAILAVGGNGIGFLLICLLVPLYEEIVFRGVILDACQRYLNFTVANVIQAVLFAAIHMSLYLFPVFLLFGLVAGMMRKNTGGLLAGIVFHVLNNMLAIGLLLLR